MEGSLYAVYIPGRIFVGKFAEEDGRKVLNDAAESRTLILRGEVQEQLFMIGKLYIPAEAVIAKLASESVLTKVYIQMTSGLKLI